MHCRSSTASARPWLPSGYLPRSFELWTIPKGFFLVLRHHPSWADKAVRLLEGVTARLARIPELVAFNARRLAHDVQTAAVEVYRSPA